MRAFQFHSQTLVSPLLSVWSELSGTDDLKDSSPRYGQVKECHKNDDDEEEEEKGDGGVDGGGDGDEWWWWWWWW